MKKKIIVILCIVICILGAFFIKKSIDKKTYDSLYVNFVEKNEFEYGSELQALDLIVDHSGNIKSMNEIDSMNVSKQIIQVVINEGKIERVFEKEINIVDTQKPIIELNNKEVQVEYGKTYDFKKNIKKVYDVVDGELTYEIIEEVNFNSAGTYEVKIKVNDHNGNETIEMFTLKVKEKVSNSTTPTYINGILLVNKTYGLPSSYGNGNDPTAYQALIKLQNAAKTDGHDLPLLSGYRSYATQQSTFKYWCDLYGVEYAQNVSARPGHSEHQTGLAFDVASLKNSFGETKAGKWLEEHCAEYGFILRYPKNKTHITGYYYEPWHIRYVGVEHSIPIMSQGLTLEEYLGVKS